MEGKDGQVIQMKLTLANGERVQRTVMLSGPAERDNTEPVKH
jgi:hypothetical protein